MEPQENKPSLYERLDSKVMKGVNAGVRAWNWTTGRTKADLAKLSILVGSPAVPATLLSQGSPTSAVIVGMVYLSGVYHDFSKFEEIEEKELNATKNQAVSLDVEKYKELCREVSGYQLAVSPLTFFPDKPLDTSLQLYIASSVLARYVMRADYLPPRKDCVRRGLDKLSEKLSEIEIPTPLPQPAFSYNLEVI